jgi:hypothetical protein
LFAQAPRILVFFRLRGGGPRFSFFVYFFSYCKNSEICLKKIFFCLI